MPCMNEYRVVHGRTQFVAMKLKLPPQYELLILNRNSYFNVNKKVVLEQMNHPVIGAVLIESQPRRIARMPCHFS